MLADLLQKEKPKEAEAALRRAVDTKKDPEVCYQRLIAFYRDTNQPDKLAKAIEEAQKALPDAYQITASSPE
jgi:hypothetical protein